jgi:hypothetical protein
MTTFSSAERFCAAATSKKPPQVRKFVGGDLDLDGNGFEHLKKLQ